MPRHKALHAAAEHPHRHADADHGDGADLEQAHRSGLEGDVTQEHALHQGGEMADGVELAAVLQKHGHVDDRSHGPGKQDAGHAHGEGAQKAVLHAPTAIIFQ